VACQPHFYSPQLATAQLLVVESPSRKGVLTCKKSALALHGVHGVDSKVVFLGATKKVTFFSEHRPKIAGFPLKSFLKWHEKG